MAIGFAERVRPSEIKPFPAGFTAIQPRDLIGCGDLEAGFNVNAISFMSDSAVIGPVDMGSVDSPYPFAVMIPQSGTERLLEERLTELVVTVERSVEVSAMSQQADGVAATLIHPDGRQDQVDADWLVGRDGAHSLVRHSLGATFDGKTNESNWRLADVPMSGYPLPDTEAAGYWHAG